MAWIIFTILLIAIAVGTFKLRLGEQTVQGTDYRGNPATTTKFGLGSKGLPIISIGAVLLLALATLPASFYTIEAGHIGLVKTFKEYTGQSGPGLHLKAPWQTVDEVNGRVQKAVVTMNGGENGSAVSKETQPVYATLTVNYQVELAEAQELYTEVGADYYKAIVEPRVQQAFKAITVEFSTAEVAPNREEIRKRARKELSKQLDPYGITVNDFLIKNLDFSPEFVAAIERKQVATQDAKAANEKVAQVKAEAAQKIAQAEGEAKAAQINGQALQKNPLYLQQLAIERLNPNVQVIMIPSNGQNMILPSSIFGGAGK